MVMFLSLLCISLLAVAVLSAIVYGAAPRDPRPGIRPETRPGLEPPQFFGGDRAHPPAGPALPVDLVIAQLERHVRLERAAAESVLNLPLAETVHPSAHSRLVN